MGPAVTRAPGFATVDVTQQSGLLGPPLLSAKYIADGGGSILAYFPTSPLPTYCISEWSTGIDHYAMLGDADQLTSTDWSPSPLVTSVQGDVVTVVAELTCCAQNGASGFEIALGLRLLTGAGALPPLTDVSQPSYGTAECEAINFAPDRFTVRSMAVFAQPADPVRSVRPVLAVGSSFVSPVGSNNGLVVGGSLPSGRQITCVTPGLRMSVAVSPNLT